MSLALLHHLYGDGVTAELLSGFTCFTSPDTLLLNNCHRLLRDDPASLPQTCGAGRWFDAVSALLGVCLDARYEGQPAILLEQKALETGIDPENPPRLLELTVSPEEAIRSFIDALPGNSPAHAALDFHLLLAGIFIQQTMAAASTTGITTACLSGGVFHNRILFNTLVRELSDRGLTVHTHSQIPTNDGGISLGQAYYAALKLSETSSA